MQLIYICVSCQGCSSHRCLAINLSCSLYICVSCQG
nr:MAG TPA: hypothetical protein [Caudoviricetes sp.]